MDGTTFSIQGSPRHGVRWSGHRFGVILVALLMAGIPQSARSGPAARPCVAPTAQEAMSIGRSHLEAYLHPERSVAVPLAEGVRRTELPPGLPRELGGALAATSAAEMRAYYVGQPTVRFIKRFYDYRWILDLSNCEATVFFLMDYELGPVRFFIHFGERFRISDGLIEEIEGISWRASVPSGSCWPDRGDPDEGRTGLCPPAAAEPVPYGPTPGCVPTTRDQTIDVAQTYLDALVSKDADDVPLASEARRTEHPPPDAGPATGSTGSEIAASIENDSRFGSIVAVREVRWTVDAARCLAVAFSMVDHDLDDPVRPGSRYHVTRFLVSDGLIREIEDISHRPLDPTRFEGSCWPRSWSDLEDETYRAMACPAQV